MRRTSASLDVTESIRRPRHRSGLSGSSYAASVSGSLDGGLEAATGALRSADWAKATTLFRAIVDAKELGEAWFGLGVASWWQGDVTGSLGCWERAHAAFRRAGDNAQAVIAAFYLCLSYRMSLGNDVAANGWLRQAMALVDEHDLGPVAGWVLLARAYTANDSHDSMAAADLARQTLALAKELGDRDLVVCATCELGYALAALGDLDEGGSLLDQAMAAALGGDREDLDTVVLVSCRTITACRRAADLKRAAQWISAAESFQRSHGSTHLFTTCKTHHGAVLFAAGDWTSAEAELELAVRCAGEAETALRADAAGVLAELRIAQGRLDDARGDSSTDSRTSRSRPSPRLASASPPGERRWPPPSFAVGCARSASASWSVSCCWTCWPRPGLSAFSRSTRSPWVMLLARTRRGPGDAQPSLRATPAPTACSRMHLPASAPAISSTSAPARVWFSPRRRVARIGMSR